MKFYCIIPATKDKEGVCVLPTMQEPTRFPFLGYTERLVQNHKLKEWNEHLSSRLPFPTSCDRVGWFSGESIVEIFVNGKWQPTGGRTGVIPEEYRREFIVPQSEEKDLAPEEWSVRVRYTLSYGHKDTVLVFDHKPTECEIEQNVDHWAKQRGLGQRHGCSAEWGDPVLTSERDVLPSLTRKADQEAGKQNPVEQKDEPKDGLTVRKYMLKRFPTDEFMDCPVPKEYWTVIQDYAEAYHASKVEPQPAPKEDSPEAAEVLKKHIGNVSGFHKLTEWHRKFILAAMKEYAESKYTESEVREAFSEGYEAAIHHENFDKAWREFKNELK
jgi:hypothetical protein